MTDLEWSAPFDNDEVSSVTPVPYGDLHTVSPYVATPQVCFKGIFKYLRLRLRDFMFVEAAIDLILSSLAVDASDYLVDLGCGVGSINVTAATRYGVGGLGVDIDPSLVRRASQAAEEAGVEHLVSFRQEDVALTDLSQATAVVSFLVPRHLKSLRHKLLTFLDGGGKIACYHYPITGVTPHNVIELKEGQNKYIYIYKHL